MPWDQLNLANTVRAHGGSGLARSRCTVWRPKRFPPYWVAHHLAEDGPPPIEATHTNYHEWSDHRGGLTKGARCLHCRKTLRETMAAADEVYGVDEGSADHLARALRTGV